MSWMWHASPSLFPPVDDLEETMKGTVCQEDEMI